MTQKTLLCILDGWGASDDIRANAIKAANTPNFDNLMAECPNSLLATSGLDVGLPEGQMGNSEVGHMTIGGGRVVLQNLPKINKAIADGEIIQKQQIKDIIASKKDTHILGIASDGGVHGHVEHIIATAKILDDNGVKTYLHLFTDGRDVSPSSAGEFISQIESQIAGTNIQIATVSGRYYAMDRDNRWERIELTYNAIILGEGAKSSTAQDAISASYANNVTDEFIIPSVVGNYTGANDGDNIIITNFRADRAREISYALIADNKFDGFARSKIVSFSNVVAFVEYAEFLNEYCEVLFPSENLNNSLGQIVSEAGLKQLRTSETEKYAHITFFFNGGVESIFTGEERKLVPSPDVATYDLQPAMSAVEVTDGLVEALNTGEHSLIVVNFANTDMVGHTGNLAAATKAVEAVDVCLGRLLEAIKVNNYAMLITADHGNAEQMVDYDTNEPHTQHTLNRVPLIAVGVGDVTLADGSLADIAPTILNVMDIDVPADMTGKNLLVA